MKLWLIKGATIIVIRFMYLYLFFNVLQHEFVDKVHQLGQKKRYKLCADVLER